jgi:hypothetical protein
MSTTAAVCTVTRCSAAPFDEARDCSLVDGARVCLAPPIACVPVAEPCAKPVPAWTALEILITVALIAVIGAMVAGARRADRIAKDEGAPPKYEDHP